ncbi:MAG: CBS domain-containing protein [Aigarchaeota archaeon]|nr:CBS domain-containing protein [Candidatus Pelearchaeum maunauluense]
MEAVPLFKRYVKSPEIKVRHLMSSPPIVVSSGVRVDEAVRVMWDKRVGSVIVVDDEGRLAGIFTERDVIFAAAKEALCASAPITDLMSRNVITVGPDDDAVAVERMRQANVRHLPVIDASGKPVGMLSMRDIVDAASLLLRIFAQSE